MACPYFSPTDPLPWKFWRGRLRPPLGELYDGHCSAGPTQPYRPSTGHLAECCNLGYARGKCDRMPAGGPDAVRFSVTKRAGTADRVIQVIETEGQLDDSDSVEFEASGQVQLSAAGSPAIERQAEAFLRSYLRAAQEPQTRLTLSANVQHTENSSCTPQ